MQQPRSKRRISLTNKGDGRRGEIVLVEMAEEGGCSGRG
jgi:hypothetical protein